MSTDTPNERFEYAIEYASGDMLDRSTSGVHEGPRIP